MSISTQSGSVYTDINALDQLKYKLKGDSVADLRVAAQQFEALFIQQMLKTMREAKLADGAFDSNEGDLYVEMLDKQMALNLSQGKGIGLADVIVNQMSRNLNLKPDNSDDKSASNTALSTAIVRQSTAASVAQTDSQAVGSQPINSPSEAAVVPTPTDTHNTALSVESEKSQSSNNAKEFSSPESFIKKLWPLAEKASQEIGVAPQYLIAQAALETGWGKHITLRENGSSSYNLFNIKAGSSWQGKTVTLPTTELRDGSVAKEYAAFRVYDSYETSFKDYVNLIKNNDRYRQALKNSANATGYMNALQNSGYATDPAYAEKITQIADSIPLKI